MNNMRVAFDLDHIGPYLRNFQQK